MEGFWEGPDDVLAKAALGLRAEVIPPLARQLPIKWGLLRPDPIHDLLNHSDCDGSLTPGQCAKIVPRLEKLIEGGLPNDYDRQQALLLCQEMREAAKAKRP